MSLNQGYGQASWNFGTVPGGPRTRITVKEPFSNTRKTHLNLWYCFTCGYDVDHPGNRCPVAKPNHIPNVPRDEAHTVPGACMKAAHKTLPDGTGAGKGWILSQNLTKHQWAMPNSQNPWQQRNTGGAGRGGGRRNNRNRDWRQRGHAAWGQNNM